MTSNTVPYKLSGSNLYVLKLRAFRVLSHNYCTNRSSNFSKDFAVGTPTTNPKYPLHSAFNKLITSLEQLKAALVKVYFWTLFIVWFLHHSCMHKIFLPIVTYHLHLRAPHWT